MSAGIQPYFHGIIHTVLKNGRWILITYKWTVSFRVFDFNLAIFVQTCLYWPCLGHQRDDSFFSFSIWKMEHEDEFLGCILYLQMPDFRSSRGIFLSTPPGLRPVTVTTPPRLPAAWRNDLRLFYIVPRTEQWGPTQSSSAWVHVKKGK